MAENEQKLSARADWNAMPSAQDTIDTVHQNGVSLDEAQRQAEAKREQNATVHAARTRVGR